MWIDLPDLCTKIETHTTHKLLKFFYQAETLNLTQHFSFLLIFFATLLKKKNCHFFSSFFFSLQCTTTKSESNHKDELGANLKDEEHARYATTRSQHQQGLDLFLVGLWTLGQKI